MSPGVEESEPPVSLLLASRSPRRRALLLEAGLHHEADHPGIDDAELAQGCASPAEWVASLAYLKARAGLASWREAGRSLPPIVLGADTVCVVGGEVIGQPADRDEAETTLRGLIASEQGHDVLTGVALIASATDARQIFVDRARVRFGHPGETALVAYLDSGLWQGKAGAYNLAERLDAGWPIEFEGDPTTVMGLPMRLLAARLASFGDSVSADPAA